MRKLNIILPQKFFIASYPGKWPVSSLTLGSITYTKKTISSNTDYNEGVIGPWHCD